MSTNRTGTGVARQGGSTVQISVMFSIVAAVVDPEDDQLAEEKAIRLARLEQERAGRSLRSRVAVAH